jgi:hypothetical protein
LIKIYLQFINQGEDESVSSPVKYSQHCKNTDLKDEVKSMIEKTIDKSGGEFKSFVNKFIKTPEDVKIEGFINDSDIYEFYLKFRNDIDELLNNIKYFNEVPSESNTFGLYDYIINGTEKAVSEIVKDL